MKKSVKIILGIIVILVVAIIIKYVINNNDKDMLASLYSTMSNSEEFTFTMEVVDSSIPYTLSVAQSGENMNIDMISEDARTSTLLLDGYIYYILHDEKEYSLINEDSEGNIIIEALSNIYESEYEKGKEEIYGTKYYYEEYNDCYDFTVLLAIDTNDTNKTRFYFDDEDLVYIKTITIDDEGNQEEELLNVTISYEADSSLFEIPSDYAEI